MKRIIRILTVLLMFCVVETANANSWDLRGELLDKVSKVNTWNEYSTICKQADNATVMGNQYHNTLMMVEDGELKVYPTAVYQPEHPLADTVKLEKNGDMLILTYSKAKLTERYVFSQSESDYCLTEAVIGEFRMEMINENGWRRFKVYDANDEAYLQRSTYLNQFNIELFPRSVEEVKHLNYMLAVLDSGEQVLLDEGVHLSAVGKGTAPVYSAPFGDAAWRAGNGKAAVGLKGELWMLRTFAGGDGENYTLIKYNISERTQRIGCIRTKDIGEEYSLPTWGRIINVDLIALHDTYLTDDPSVSQYPQFQVPLGKKFNCMATYNDQYAYVSAEVKDGKFVNEGQKVWGFVPLADLDVDPDGNYVGAIQPDVMERLEGSWVFYSGGNQAQDKLTFYSDGTYQGFYYLGEDLGNEIDTGTYIVTAYKAECNLYWNNPLYEITLKDEDGTVNIKGLSFGEEEGKETFSLTYWEGGGGYMRIDEEKNSVI